MPNILILTEGGEGIGLGHFTRCSALKNEALRNEISCRLLLYWRGESSPPDNVELCDWHSGLENLRNRFSSDTFIVIDSYILSANGYLLLKNFFSKVIAIDDYNRIIYPPIDLIVNPNVYFPLIDYSLQAASCIGGKDYVILRHLFRNFHGEKNISENIKNVIITMGGSDYRGIIPRIASSFLDDKFNYQFICGDELSARLNEKQFKKDNSTFYGYVSESQMKDLMLRADIAITACGQTLHELVHLGTPAIGICIDKDQEYNARFYVSVGVLPKMIYWNDSDLIPTIKSFLGEYDFFRRCSVSQIGYSLFNKNGIENILNEIISGC